MKRKFGILTGVDNFDAGKTATLNIPTDRRYFGIFLQVSNGGNLVTRAEMEELIGDIRIYMGGVQQWDIKARELLAIYERHNRVFRNGILPIYFAQPWRRSSIGEDGTSLETRGVFSTMQIELELAATVGGQPATPNVKLYNSYDRALPSHYQAGLAIPPSGVIPKYTRHQMQISAIGPYTYTNFPTVGSLWGLHAFEQQLGDIADARIMVDGTEEFFGDRTMADFLVADGGGLPVAGMFSIPFDWTERSGHKLDLSKIVNGTAQRAQSEVRFEMTAANGFSLVQEYVGQPNRGAQ